ncbi:MAG: hypothetical protein K1W25_10505 [Lachnospiraceae bacterium]
MPWCPLCRNEYIEGKTRCPDCDTELVSELAEYSEEKSAPYIPTEEELAELAARKAAAAHMTTYTSAKTRHSETKSSAWTFLIIGSIGFFVITMALFGIITLPLNKFSLFIMEAMFIIFLSISGISFKNAAKMLDEISREDRLETRIKAWAKENLTAGELTAGLEADTSEEMKYFMVSALIRERLMLAFPEVDDAYAEELTENFYNKLFSEDGHL